MCVEEDTKLVAACALRKIPDSEAVAACALRKIPDSKAGSNCLSVEDGSST